MRVFMNDLGHRAARRQRGVRVYLSLVLLAILAVLSTAIVVPKAASADTGPVLYVFINSAEKPRTLQKKLETGMPGVVVTVFGRFRDFESAIEAARPDAVLALQPVLTELGMKPSLQGTYKSSPDEAYALVAVGKSVDAATAAQLTIGSVDILGRSMMKNFVGKVLGTTTAPKVKLVTKTEDLLPLLQFGQADVVLLPERQTALLTGRSELDLKVSILPNRVHLVAAAAVTPKGQSVLSLVKNLDTSVSADMGVDSWR